MYKEFIFYLRRIGIKGWAIAVFNKWWISLVEILKLFSGLFKEVLSLEQS